MGTTYPHAPAFPITGPSGRRGRTHLHGMGLDGIVAHVAGEGLAAAIEAKPPMRVLVVLARAAVRQRLAHLEHEFVFFLFDAHRLGQ